MNFAQIAIALSSLTHFVIPAAFSYVPFIDAQHAKAYGTFNDGGTIQSIQTMCTCSGGTLINFQSYVDNQNHQYIYQLGASELYENYNIYQSGNYFLDTHIPFGICLVTDGDDCRTEGNPEGTLMTIGTS